MEAELPVGCPEHETVVRKPWDEAKSVIEEHNEKMHDGEPVAGVRVRDEGKVVTLPHPDNADEAVVERVKELLEGEDA